jgi:hypothetical protein
MPVTEHFNSYFCLLAALASRWTGPMEQVSPAASSREDTPMPDERDCISTPVPYRSLGEGSSDSDEVAFQQDHFAKVRASFCSCHVTVMWDTEYAIEVSSVSQQRIGIIHPEEPPFIVSRFNIFTYSTLNFNDCKSVISVLNFPCLVFTLFYCSKSLVALHHVA